MSSVNLEKGIGDLAERHLLRADNLLCEQAALDELFGKITGWAGRDIAHTTDRDNLRYMPYKPIVIEQEGTAGEKTILGLVFAETSSDMDPVVQISEVTNLPRVVQPRPIVRSMVAVSVLPSGNFVDSCVGGTFVFGSNLDNTAVYKQPGFTPGLLSPMELDIACAETQRFGAWLSLAALALGISHER